MRPFILVLLLLAPTGDAAAQDPLFVVRAIHEESGLAFANVLIQVRQVETDLLYAEARTDVRGMVSIRVAPLQWYAVRAVARGFTSRDELLMAPEGGTIPFPVALESIEPRLPQFKYGAVSGYVLSPEGEPLPKIIVMAAGVHSPPIGGGRTLTERDGSFRMNLPAGTYKISTIESNPFPPFNTIPPVFDVYGPTEVAPVAVAADRVTAGVAIYPPRERRFRARVTVVGDAGPASEGHVEWRASNGRGLTAPIRDGVADLGPLAVGPFAITAVAGPKPSQLAGTTTIEIVDAPLDEVVVNVFAGGRASGRLVGPDGRPFRLPAGPRWWVVPNAVGSLSRAAGSYEVERDGRFLVTGLIGERCLLVFGKDTHVMSVTHGGVDYTGRAFSFEHGQEISDIVIRMAPGSVFHDDAVRCAR
jgi:hypothetical protein